MNRPFEPQLILVVNNNTETRYAAARALQSAGFATLEAASGAEELRLIGSNVALVIVDINLPDMDGFSVCKAIRAREDVARVPVIHLSSSFTSDVDRAHGYNSGADGYLTHPVDPRVLIATVNAFLRSRMADEAARLSEDKFCRVFRYAADGIAILDSGFSFVDANPQLCRILAVAPADLIGSSLIKYLSAMQREIFPAIQESLRAAGDWRGTLRVARSSGEERDLEWNISIHSRSRAFAIPPRGVALLVRQAQEREV